MIVSVMVVATPLFAQADALNRQLQVGMHGTDVSTLQTFLATDPTLYPQGLVTGYFGFLTKSAVSNFQSRNDLPPVGRVGPMTLPVLNFQIANGMPGRGDMSAAVITNVSITTGRTTATVGWATSESAKGVVYYSTSPLTTYENPNSVDVSGNTSMTDNGLHTTQNISLQGLQPNTTYYYLIYTTDQAGNVSVTWPATFQTSN